MPGGERKYRRVFKENAGPPPWSCDHCGHPVDMDELEVHHRDENRSNNEFSNLGAMHHGCHNAHHRKGKPQPKAVEAMRQANLGTPCAEETKQKISEANKRAWARRKEMA